MVLGIFGKKLGMTQVYDKAGAAVPVTVIEALPCFVTRILEEKKAVQIGTSVSKRSTKPILGSYAQSGVKENLNKFEEFGAEDTSKVSLGQQIKTDIFEAGEKVSVIGVSIGKGFAGTVKRHHFMRSHMTHGSKSHRIPGSIGAGTTPGRVYKGKRMAGRMGGEKVTVKNLMVFEADPEKNIVLIKGAVPGPRGAFVTIKRTAAKKAEKKK
ncbi:MAG: 50S ribosomal protein L3 [Candidatus Margulisiibacteriota bacterium]